MKQSYLLLLIASLLLVQTALTVPSLAKKPITITQRHTMLMSEVKKAEKSGDLTAKEAQSLRDSDAKIVEKENRMKSANDGKLSYKNINEIERDLNKMSVKLQKLELAKRVVK